MRESNSNFKFVNLFKKWSWIILIISIALQFVFFEYKNQIFPIICAILGWSLCSKFVLKNDLIIKYTLSSFLLLGFAITQFLIPPFFSLVENKPLIYNLKYPNSVSLHSILAYSFLLASFHIYKKYFFRVRIKLNFFFSKHTQLYETPSDLTLWLIGFFGILSLVVSKAIFGSSDDLSGSSNILIKFIQGFGIYAYAPLLLPIGKLYTKSSKTNYSKIYLGCYIILLIGVGITINSRGTFMQGLTILVLCYFLGLLIGRFPFIFFSLKNILVIVFSFWLITGPLSDLGTAMVIARGEKDNLTTSELFKTTLQNYDNKTELKQYKKLISKKSLLSDWDETYFDNIFITRFSNLKYPDASLEQAYKTETPNSRFREILLDKIWATFPQPIMDLFDIDIDKKKIGSGSIGDFLYNVNSGTGIGGFRTGNFIGVDFAAFGWFYLPILSVLVVPFYILVDSLNFYKRKNKNPIFSIPTLLSLLFCFTYFGVSTASESVTSLFTFCLRGYLQYILTYLIIFFLAKSLTIFLKRS